MVDPHLLGIVILLGIVTGMRSLMGLALLAWLAPPTAWLATPWARGLLGLFAVGELVADKLPKTPSRLSPGPLGARLVLGAVIGALLMTQANAPVVLGAIVGALSAAAGAFAGNKARGALGRLTGFPDLWFALSEDVIAIAIGAWALLGPLGHR